MRGTFVLLNGKAYVYITELLPDTAEFKGFNLAGKNNNKEKKYRISTIVDRNPESTAIRAVIKKAIFIEETMKKSLLECLKTQESKPEYKESSKKRRPEKNKCHKKRNTRVCFAH